MEWLQLQCLLLRNHYISDAYNFPCFALMSRNKGNFLKNQKAFVEAKEDKIA